jgi:DNA replication protein DnaC
MQHQLTYQLKTLRLGGMCESLEVRLKQATDDNLGYLEFLELIVEDEIARREARKLTRRLKQAQFEEEKTLEGFDFASHPHLPRRKIKDLAACRFIIKQENILICGPCGVGKTHLAQAIGHQACRMGYKVFFSKSSHLFRQLAAARADGSWDDKVRGYGKVDLLIIDDFGLKNLTTQQADDIYEVVAERHLKGGMLFTSNRSVDDWLGLFPDPIFANSVLDRFAHNAHQITIKGESYRKNKKPTEMTD